MSTLPTSTPGALALTVIGASATWLAASQFDSSFDRGAESLADSDPERVTHANRVTPPSHLTSSHERPTRIAARTRTDARHLAAPFERASRASSAIETGASQAPLESNIEAEVESLVSRMDATLALFDDPTPEALAQWHAGRSLADLAGAVHDAQEATNWLGARALAPASFAAHEAIDGPLAQLAERAATLEAERSWLYQEVDRRACSPTTLGSQHLHRLDDEAIGRMFPTARDRYILATLLNQEAQAIGRTASRHEIDAQRLAALAGKDEKKVSRFAFT